jgi:hypothetical protein
MVKTPQNATEYLKSLLGKQCYFHIRLLIYYILDFAAEKIPPTKHRETPCNIPLIFYSFILYSILSSVYILATAGLRFLTPEYE